MSSTHADPAPGPAGAVPAGSTLRAAVAGGAIAVAVLVTILVAHAVSGGSTPAKSTSSSSAGSMNGMSMSTGANTSNLPKPMAMAPLGPAKVWQGMKIEAIRSAPLTFGVFSGTSMNVVKKTKKDSFHLMVKLTDVRTGASIPYATVWCTITKNGKIVFDERQWPMLSLYMGDHYGNNVALPGPGTYKLTVLIGPPQVARHPEYMHVWLKPHRVTYTFRWKGAAA
ncbi:MAG TPA: iron transporter [Gaiellaceae bacterium]|nr:iron transporter [Gaiellaceae bacterium]